MAEESREILEYFPAWKLQDFGLGRGVNGTDPQPWVNKSTLQIREIVREDLQTSSKSPSKMYETNLIGTNEGGVDHHFVQEVTKIKDQKAKLASSITVPNSPVTVGVGADMSRSLSTTQKAIGKRIINRTVSFTVKYTDAAEEKLAELIVDSADSIEKDLTKTDKTSVQLMKRLGISTVKELFTEFVSRYRVTHYVSSISLGASRFTVQSESAYNKGASVSGEIGVQQVAQAKVSASYVEKNLKKAKNVQRIGVLSEDDKKVTQEAVVDVRMEPISSLFQTKLFRTAMQSVLNDFFDAKDFGKEGPYLISCDDATIFLKVVLDDNDQAFVYGTTNIDDASDFHITLTDEGSCRPYEFYIGWQKSETAAMPGTMRYLNAPLSMTGYHAGPLSIERRGKKRYSVFAISSRLIDSFCGLHMRTRSSDNLNPEAWFKGLESFLISCHGRAVGMGGYLAIQRNTGASKEEYRTICKPDAGGRHSRYVHMTFQLHPKDKKKNLFRPVVKKDERQSVASKSDTNQEASQEIQHE